MNRHVNAIAGRLSLRPPQRESLEILDRITEIVPPSKSPDAAAALAIIKLEFPKVTDFEREFPSICFALATGVGKTRLMGAFISFLHLAKGINNFFVLAPNLTIYNKLIADFTPNTPKYVFKGIAEFATDAPEIITGDNYDQRAGGFAELTRVRINIFNISKINSEVRGGNSPRIKRLSEYIGESYFDYLAGLPDLVMLMDESHRYRASAGIRAINELKPMLGLELTATPFVETAKGALPFKNVVYDYPLARAMAVRTGVTAVDRLNIVAHDKFQEIVDEANKPDSAVRLTQVILDPAKDLQPTKTVIAQPTIMAKLTAAPAPAKPGEKPSKAAEPLFQTEQERKIAEITVKVIQQHETLPQVNYLQKAEVQAAIIKEVAATYVAPAQTELTGIVIKPDIAAIVAKATKLVIDQTIDIPRIVVVPTGDVTSGFNTFTLDCSSIHLQPVSRELLIQHLRTAKQEFLQNVSGQLVEARPENYIVRALIDFDDISYDDHADLLYDLAGQLVKHLHSYLSAEDTINVLQYHQQQLAALIHSQMQLPEHRWEKATGYKATVSKGFSALKENAYTANATDDIKPFRMTVSDPTNIKRYVFGGFSKCLYEIQKFDVDTERRFAVILEDDGDVLKWFKPARNQFQIYYNKDAAYEPDFVVETKKQLFLCEPKRADQMQNPEVVAKKTAASEWCKHATEHAQQHGGKKWSYLLIPHDAITGNMTLAGLASRFAIS